MSPRSRIFAFEVFHFITIRLCLLSHCHGFGGGGVGGKLGFGDTCKDVYKLEWVLPYLKKYIEEYVHGPRPSQDLTSQGGSLRLGVRWSSWENTVYWPPLLWVSWTDHGYLQHVSFHFLKVFFSECWPFGRRSSPPRPAPSLRAEREKELNAQDEASTGWGSS